MENVDIYALIDELQEVIEQSKNCAFSKNKSVDASIILEIIDDMRNALDETLQYAKEIEGAREKVLTAAHAEADAIVKEAQIKAQDMVSESTITKAAYEQSQKILDKTKQKASDMKRMAIEYAQDVFADLEEYYKDSAELLNENTARLEAKRDK